MLNTHLFADDSNLFTLTKVLNQELIKVNNWLSVNKLSLNIEKSNFVIFHPHQKIAYYHLNITINRRKIQQVKDTKYLGVRLDSNLNWKSHAQEISKKNHLTPIY